MAILGYFGPQAFVVLVVAVIGIVPVTLYYNSVSRWFLAAFAFLFFAAFATNFENVFLPDLMNFLEHLIGNLGAGIAFAVAAYMYRQRSIKNPDDVRAEAEA